MTEENIGNTLTHQSENALKLTEEVGTQGVQCLLIVDEKQTSAIMSKKLDGTFLPRERERRKSKQDVEAEETKKAIGKREVYR